MKVKSEKKWLYRQLIKSTEENQLENYADKEVI
jgi:hypothetical protein